MLSIILYIFGGICILYDALLILRSPGTFMDNLTAFSHIWLMLGGYHIFLGVYRKQRGHSFWCTWKKWIKKAFIVVAGIAGVFTFVSLLFICNPKKTNMEESADYVILLGGGIDKDGKLPRQVQKRVNRAADYLLVHPEAVCVVTGGTLKWLPYAEAPKIKELLVSKGVVNDRILVEDQALDTIQNFQYGSAVLADYSGNTIQQILESKIVVVTSDYHLRRAEILAERMGFKNIKGLPAKTDAFGLVHAYVREVCAYLKLSLRILLTGEPSEITEIIYPQL